ncbi:MAG: hypothetical protein IJK14_06290 [Clostridia bacterium]|nr:hypothetical protein [Clostridia bacterium]MBR0444963.1 hypothetical protein [Clostridia bacterium]
MRLYIKKEKVDVKNRTEMVGQAYGIKHPEKVHGFAGFFLRGDPDTYLSDGTEAYLNAHPEFETEIQEAVRRFRADDFGLLPKFDVQAQLEDIYMFGAFRWKKGIYETSAGILTYERFYEDALIYLEGEQESVDRFADADNRKNPYYEERKKSK